MTFTVLYLSKLSISISSDEFLQDEAALTLDDFKDEDMQVDLGIDGIYDQLELIVSLPEVDERQFDHAEQDDSFELSQDTMRGLIPIFLHL